MTIQDTINFCRPENAFKRNIVCFHGYAKHLGGGSLAIAKLKSIVGNSLAKEEVRKAAEVVLKEIIFKNNLRHK